MRTTQIRTRTSRIEFVLLQCTEINDNEAVYDLG
jgi:hypothetical protein